MATYTDFDGADAMELKLNAQELQAYMDKVFPQVGGLYRIDALAPNSITVRQPATDDTLRPGGTVSGPTLFSLADVSVYMAVLAMIGREALAVTTNASIDFMRKPAAGVDLIADCRLLKLGRVLAVGDVLIRSENRPEPVARASMTYSIPRK